MEDIENFLSSIHLPSISTAQLETISTAFSPTEILKTIKKLPLHKAPSPDGFPNEYYKCLSDLITPHLCNTFNHYTTMGKISKESQEALIVTLPKPGKSPDSPANYRPISLLNTDTKLYAKLLAQRLSTIIPQIIHPDQVGFVPGRQASDGTRRLIDLIQWVEHRLLSSFL